MNMEKNKSAKTALLTTLVVLSSSLVQAQTETCVSISTSKECSAFTPFSVSTDSFLVGLYPFLSNVNNAASFDTQLSSYINTSYVQEKYDTLFGCGNVLLTNTTDLYARYTTSVVCNGVIQNSKDRCNLSDAESRPLCANSCAEFALSESVITSNTALCSDPSNYTDTQIRADFTNCALPAQSLQNSGCIQGSTNEPNNCGFGGSTLGLCTYCSQSSEDTCCSSSQAGTRCASVAIPSSISPISLPTGTSSMASASTAKAGQATSNSSSSREGAASRSSSDGLSGTTIAVVVVGCVVGVVLLGLLIFLLFCCRKRRRRQKEAATTAVGVQENKPVMTGEADSDASSGARTPSIRPHGPNSDYTVLPGGRIARKSVVESVGVVSSRIVPGPTQPNFLSKEPLSTSQIHITTPLEEDQASQDTAHSREFRVKKPTLVDPTPLLPSSTHPSILWTEFPPEREDRDSTPTKPDSASDQTPFPENLEEPTGNTSPTVALASVPPNHDPEKTASERRVKAPTPPRKDSILNSTIVTSGGAARTATAVDVPSSDPVPATNDHWQLFKSPTSYDQLEQSTHLDSESSSVPNPLQSKFNSVDPQAQIDASEPPRPPVGPKKNRLFPYPLALLGLSGANSAKSSRIDLTPALGPADMKNHELLPGGRLVRKHVPKASPKASPKSSPKPSRQSSRASNPQRKPEAPPPTPQSKRTTGSVEQYQQLPGGRMVRTTALENHMHNQGLKPSSKLRAPITVGAAAVASAARLRESDEKSRAGTPSATPPATSSEAPRRIDELQGENIEDSQKTPTPQPAAPAVSADNVNIEEDDDPLQRIIPPTVPSFQDSYSDSIFTASSIVAVVWSYQPQTQDEFALERGDMLEVVSIWNDGWATGRLSTDRIDSWEAKHGILIDTDLIDLGTSGSEGRPQLNRTPTSVVKAFPLVCVCSPRYWRKAVRES